MKVGMQHAERLKDTGIGKLAERLAADSFDDTAEQVVRAIVVLEFGSRQKIKPSLTRQHLHNRVVHIATILARGSQTDQSESLTQSARVSEDVTDCNPVLP